MEETIARYEKDIEELERSRKEILKKAKEAAEQLLRENAGTLAYAFVQEGGGQS